MTCLPAKQKIRLLAVQLSCSLSASFREAGICALLVHAALLQQIDDASNHTQIRLGEGRLIEAAPALSCR